MEARKIVAIAFLGLVIRLAIVTVNVGIDDDLMVHQEWGRVFQITGANYFYFFKGWIYSFPTQPPLTSWMFNFAYQIYENHSLLAQLHNKFGLPPGFIVKYFYDNGYVLLLKLPAIVGDIGLGLVIYKLVKKLNPKRAILAYAFYIFNPLTIFLSGIWGQTESLIALFGMLSFVALSNKKIYLAIPFYFISLYFKPTWGVFAPLFLFLLILVKPKPKHLAVGILVVLAIFLTATMPFANGNLVGFTKDIVINNMLPTAKGTARASVSAFNLHSIFLSIDDHLAEKGISFITPSLIGYLGYFVINLVTFRWLLSQKINPKNVVTAIFIVGAGSFILLANMLERYIFIAFPALVVLMFVDKGIIFWGLVLNLVMFVNMFWAFYRRSSAEIVIIFSYANSTIVRLLSLANVVSWGYLADRYLHVSRFLRDKILKA